MNLTPLPFSLTQENYKQGGPNDYLPYVERPNIKGAISLDQYMKLIKSNSPALQMPNARAKYNTVPAKTFYLDVKSKPMGESSLSSDTISSGNENEAKVLPANFKKMIPTPLRNLYTDRLYINLKGNALEKKDLMILDLILTNQWERPIYFNNTSLLGVNLDFKGNVVQEGNAYRLLPIENPDPNDELVNTPVMYENMMDKFYWRELDNPDVYYNEDYRNFALNHRSSFNSLAQSLLDEGNKAQAGKVLEKSLAVMPDKSIPYDYVSAQSIKLLFEAGKKEQATEIAQTVGDRAVAMLAYMTEQGGDAGYERQKQMIILNEISRALTNAGATELGKKYEDTLMRYYNQFNKM